MEQCNSGASKSRCFALLSAGCKRDTCDSLSSLHLVLDFAPERKDKAQCREAEYLRHLGILRIFWGLGICLFDAQDFCIFGPHPTQQMNSHFFGEFTCGRCGLALLPPI